MKIKSGDTKLKITCDGEDMTMIKYMWFEHWNSGKGAWWDYKYTRCRVGQSSPWPRPYHPVFNPYIPYDHQARYNEDFEQQQEWSSESCLF